MIVIHEKNREIYKRMGEQAWCPWEKYRRIKYLVIKKVQYGELWYNTLTREIVLVEEGDLGTESPDHERTLKSLVKKWFLVPESMHDKTMARFVSQSIYETAVSMTRGLSFVTIFTTTECSAKCPYCYEHGIVKKTMSQETAEKTANYIIRNARNQTDLKWFGGEPLMNADVIDIICRRVTDAGINIRSDITTNGYYLDQITDYQIVDMWNLKSAQITIDGTEPVHNKIKGLPNAYNKAIESIERLSGLGVRVAVRMHMTEDNYEDLSELIKELGTEFRNRRNINMYASPLYEGLGKDYTYMSMDRKKEFYRKYAEIDRMIHESGADHGRGVPKIRPFHCMADDRKSIVITPDGKLTPCEHCADSEFIGDVETGGYIPEKWFEPKEDIKECETCFFYPQCSRLKMCEAEYPCEEGFRYYKKHLCEVIMENAYKQYRERRDNHESRKGNRNSRRGRGV